MKLIRELRAEIARLKALLGGHIVSITLNCYIYLLFVYMAGHIYKQTLLLMLFCQQF